MARRRLLGDINVVPYIDVMLVLLIIFMVTAPLLTQGIEVALPEAAAAPLDTAVTEANLPLVLSVDSEGALGACGERDAEVLDRQDRRGVRSAQLCIHRQTFRRVVCWSACNSNAKQTLAGRKANSGERRNAAAGGRPVCAWWSEGKIRLPPGPEDAERWGERL